MYIKIVALLVVALLSAHQVYGQITFVGNVSLDVNNRQDWQYRKTTLGFIPVVNTAWFTSVDVQRSGLSVAGDIIVGAIHAGLMGTYPSAYLGYATANLTGSFTGSNAFNLDVAATLSFIAGAYISVVEKDPAGNVVYTLDLSSIAIWEITDSSIDGPLKYGTFQGTKLIGGYKIAFTVLISDVTGVISLAGAVITPKVLETIVQINDWPYKSVNNTLTLKAVAATGSGTLDGELFSSGSGSSQVFFQMNNTAVVNGIPAGVSVKAEATAISEFAVDDIQNMLKLKFAGSAQAKAFYVTFPAGASAITYDPAMGSGTPITQQQNKEDSSAISVFARMTEALMFCLVFLFFW